MSSANAKAFLHQHGYTVRVQGIEPNTCIAFFPNSTDVLYVLAFGSLPGVLIDGDFWSVPSYSMRPLVVSHLFYKMRSQALQLSLLMYYNRKGDEVTNINGVLESPPKVDEHKEGFLTKL